MSEHNGKCPPQFVFEMIVAQAARVFLQDEKTADEIAEEFAASFGEIYDAEALVEDIMQGVERLLVFMDSVKIDDVDLMLTSFIWFVANYESLNVKRKKKTLIGSPLKGKPKLPARVYQTATAFKAYAYAVGSNHAPIKPADWKPEDEIEFESVFVRLFPEIAESGAEEMD